MVFTTSDFKVLLLFDIQYPATHLLLLSPRDLLQQQQLLGCRLPLAARGIGGRSALELDLLQGQYDVEKAFSLSNSIICNIYRKTSNCVLLERREMLANI